MLKSWKENGKGKRVKRQYKKREPVGREGNTYDEYKAKAKGWAV